MKLTPEQIRNWRGQLAITLGPYAWVMPEVDIQRHRDRIIAKLRGKRERAPTPAPQ